MFETDAVAVIGHNHVTEGLPLQDRAKAKTYGSLPQSPPKRACATVSDGCSTGGDTDMGASLLTYAALAAVGKGGATRKSVLQQQQAAMRGAVSPDTTGLTIGDMLSTSLVLVVDDEGESWVNLQGDGAVYWKTRDGRRFAILVEWAKLKVNSSGSAPVYTVYAGSGYEELLRAHRNRRTPGPSCRAVYIEILDDDGTHEVLFTDNIPIERAVHGFYLPLDHETLFGEIEFIGVVTDGYDQVENVPPVKVIAQIMAFKSLGRGFLQRRVRKFFEFAATVGNGPLDDFGAAIIRIIKAS